ncbi:response regulator [Leptolyngbya sp. FACHB-261]|nr:response regulator [Leptolyngbya sp. FACHB-261]
MNLSGLRVLVVDDDQDSCMLYRSILELFGATVQVQHSAEEALKAIHTFSPNALLCDIVMPEMDGYSFIREVRSRGLQIPAVAVTAQIRAVDPLGVQDAEDAQAAGFDFYIVKPVELDALVAMAGQLISCLQA